jgi:UDP-GlcNAc:undecaprenyl-phosphate GlcNAc-1-phosphate transferase
MLTWMHLLTLFAVALVVTTLLVPLVRRIAIRFGIVDMPGPRRVNKKPIPRMGGVAMFVGLIVALALECILEGTGFWEGPFLLAWGVNVQFVGIIVGMTVIVGVGVLDDIFSLRPGVKFLGQLVAACIIACTGTLLARFHLPLSSTIVALDFWAYPITVLYLVCFVNIINFIDGLDGLAAGISGIAALTLFVLTTTLYRTDAAIISLILVGVCVGFLFFNFNPASIFMGDSGSMLLGLMLGTISLLGSARFSSVTIMIVPIIIALVPIIDTFAAIVRRLREHKPIQQADAGHIHHRLLRAGFTQRKAVLLIYAWTAVLSIGALLIWEFSGIVKYSVLTVLFIISAIIVWRLGLFGPIRKRHGKWKNDPPDPNDAES